MTHKKFSELRQTEVKKKILGKEKKKKQKSQTRNDSWYENDLSLIKSAIE